MTICRCRLVFSRSQLSFSQAVRENLGCAFTAKFSIFIAIGLLSIIPTVEFLSWRSAVSAGQVPAVSAKKLRLITAVIHGELLSIVIILLCAAIMARGGWV